MHWGTVIFGCSPSFAHFYFFLHIFCHFHHIYSFSELIDMVIHFDGACYKTSYFPPHFPGPFCAWILVLGIRCSTPAPMRPPTMVVGTVENGHLHLECCQDGLRLVNLHCKMESISFAI